MPINRNELVIMSRGELLEVLVEVIDDADGDVGLILTEPDAAELLADRIIWRLLELWVITFDKSQGEL